MVAQAAAADFAKRNNNNTNGAARAWFRVHHSKWLWGVTGKGSEVVHM